MHYLLSIKKSGLAAVLFGLSIVLSLQIAFAQTAPKNYVGSPVTKGRLIAVLRSKSIQTREIVKIINESGVDFEMTSIVENELTAAGARPQVIEAARGNYRSYIADSRNSKNSAKGVSKAELIRDLKSKKVSNGAILDKIETGGVAFEMNSTVEKELIAAGASPAIITALKNASKGGPTIESTASSSSSRYDRLIDEAIESYNRDVNANLSAGSPGRVEAINTLIEAAKLQPNNPTAFQQLGFMTLYGTMNGFSAAETSMRKAIDLGGSAVFRVYHDHDGFFKDVCQGSLYVAKDGVRFESDDNRHTFDTTDANIKQVKTNSSWRRAFQTRSGSFKIVLNDDADKDGKKFSFAPLTDNIEESKMVIRLIGKS